MVTIKGITYTVKRTHVGDVLMLVKNDKPVLLIPEELEEDFIQILSHAGAADKFLNQNDKDEPDTTEKTPGR